MSLKVSGSFSALTPPQVLSLPGVLPYDGYLLRIGMVGLVLCDIAMAVGCFLLAFFLRHQEPLFFRPAGMFWPTDITWAFRPYFGLLVFIPLVRVLMLRYYGLYRLRGEYAYFEDLGNLFKAITTGSLIVMVIVFLFRGGYAYSSFSYSRLVFVFDWLLALAGFGVIRIMLRMVQTLARQRSLNLIPTLIVGTGPEARVCIAEMAEQPRLGYHVVGVLATQSASAEELEKGDVEGVPIVGSFGDLTALAKQYGITEVLITDSKLPSRDIFESMMRCGRKHRLSFRVVPNLFNCLPRKTEIDQIGSLPMIKLFEDPLAGPNKFIKRTIDVVGASLGLLLISPLWAVICLLIKRESPGPAIPV